RSYGGARHNVLSERSPHSTRSGTSLANGALHVSKRVPHGACSATRVACLRWLQQFAESWLKPIKRGRRRRTMSRIDGARWDLLRQRAVLWPVLWVLDVFLRPRRVELRRGFMRWRSHRRKDGGQSRRLDGGRARERGWRSRLSGVSACVGGRLLRR